MKLSIITINYNNLSGLKRTIDSVFKQSFQDYEWIVIDGGSTDGCKELIEQNQEHFAFWCSEHDNGIYNAINKGLAHATGDYVQFLNSGDWLYENNTLEKVFTHIDDQYDIYYAFYQITENVCPVKGSKRYCDTYGCNTSFSSNRLCGGF